MVDYKEIFYILLIILLILIISLIIIKYVLHYLHESIIVPGIDKILILINKMLGPIPLSSFQKFLVFLCIIMYLIVKLFLSLIINEPSLNILVMFLSTILFILSMGILAFYEKGRSIRDKATLRSLEEIGKQYGKEE